MPLTGGQGGNLPSRPAAPSHNRILPMLLTGSPLADAEKAFARARRARRRAAVLNTVTRRGRCSARLRVIGDVPMAGAGGAVREIPLDRIAGTLEPARAELFDADFRPAARTRERWQRLWMAEQRGVVLPPISVTQIGDSYAIRDGHHRVSVARARGAATIDASLA
jgi:hypothetical protein